MSQVAAAISPTSISSWRIHVCRGRPRGRFQSSQSSGRTPVWVLTARRSASCAETDSCRRRTCPNIVIRLSHILLQIGRCLTWSITDAFDTKSNHRMPRILRMHDVWNASSLRSSDLVSVQVSAPYRRTETTRALYRRSVVCRLNLD